MAQEKNKVAPEFCAFVDDDHTRVTVEIAIPGVDKNDIKLKMHEDSFNLSAPRKNVEYVTTVAFCCPVKPEQAKAKYENGLLTIEVPFKNAMEDSVNIAIE
jgi:HSP20 family molecular chaperone IbpA